MSGSMIILEAGLRGGGIAVLLLLALFGVRHAPHERSSLYSAMLMLCGAAYLVESAPGVVFSRPPWVIPLRLLSCATPGVLLVWASANFTDSFKPSWVWWSPFAAMVGLTGWAMEVDRWWSWRAVQCAALVLVGVASWQMLGGRSDDLIEDRRRLRLILGIGAGLSITAFTTLAAISEPQVRAYGSVASAAIVLVLGMAAALSALSIRQQSEGALPAAAGPARDPLPRITSPIAIDPEERALLDRLCRLMENDRIYREEGLNIAMLARRLGLPEYRLRQLINQRLGHRNFSSFINRYRLDETLAALSDPEQAQVPILTIALDAGFQSIGPFNRAFKAQTGLTPSDFRRDRLGRSADPRAERPADFEIGEKFENPAR